MADAANSSDIDMMIDPALMSEGLSINAIHPPTETLVTRSEPDLAMGEEKVPDLTETATDYTENEHLDGVEGSPSMLPQALSEQLKMEARIEDAGQNNEYNASTLLTSAPHMRQSPELDNSYSPITVDGVVAESTEKIDVKAEEAEAVILESRHASRQPRQSTQPATDEYRLSSTTTSGPLREQRASSSSERTLETSGKSRRSSSNTSGTTHQALAMSTKPEQAREVLINRSSASDDDMDADEKFARELQAAENGLRRRASMRA